MFRRRDSLPREETLPTPWFPQTMCVKSMCLTQAPSSLAELSFPMVTAPTSGLSVACSMPPACRDSTRVVMLVRSLQSTPAPCLETTHVLFVCDIASRFFYSTQMCWAPPNYFTDQEISNSLSVAGAMKPGEGSNLVSCTDSEIGPGRISSLQMHSKRISPSDRGRDQSIEHGASEEESRTG